jgi:hypothetical protein
MGMFVAESAEASGLVCVGRGEMLGGVAAGGVCSAARAASHRVLAPVAVGGVR